VFVQVTPLYYWKQENSEITCEDAYKYQVETGRFAVADGVGTAAFSNIWSKCLVDHYLERPLLSTDPFEVEWWLSQVQERFTQIAPSLESLPNWAQEKVREGSQSTLALLTVRSVSQETAHAELIAFGDSCIFVCSPKAD
jgi:serine/threonine protein phosphatase PrpC